jgi:hypothetical protein
VKRVWAILRFFTQFGFIVFTYLGIAIASSPNIELTSQRLRYRIPTSPKQATPAERFAIALPYPQSELLAAALTLSPSHIHKTGSQERSLYLIQYD